MSQQVFNTKNMKYLERFQTFDTVEVFSKKDGYFWGTLSHCRNIRKGYIKDYHIDIESNTYDSVWICIKNTELPIKFVKSTFGLENISTCRIVLTEKFDKKMEAARLKIRRAL